MRSKRYAFNYSNVARVPDDAHGIYIFWCNAVCVYVGKAQKLSLRKRLYQHYLASHNDGLRMWIRSSHRLEFQYEVVSDASAISAKERNRIKQLAPLTNRRLLKKEF